jgi:hypothetical protein
MLLTSRCSKVHRALYRHTVLLNPVFYILICLLAAERVEKPDLEAR